MLGRRWVPCEQHSAPRRSLHLWTSVLIGYYKHPENYIIEAFDRRVTSHLPGTLWPRQRRHPYPFINRSVRNHSVVHCYDTLSLSEPVSLWRTKGEAIPDLYCYSARQCRSPRFLGHHFLHWQDYPPSGYLHRNSYGNYRLRVARYLLWRAGVTFLYLSYAILRLSSNNPNFFLFLCYS